MPRVARILIVHRWTKKQTNAQTLFANGTNEVVVLPLLKLRVVGFFLIKRPFRIKELAQKTFSSSSSSY